MEAARGILEAATRIKQGIKNIPGIKVLGDPLFVIAIASDELDIYAVSDVMTQMGWSLNGLQQPPAVHIALTQRHAQPGIAEKFLEDLAKAAAYVRAHPEMQGSMTPVYGMSGNVAFKGAVQEFIKTLIDMMFDV